MKTKVNVSLNILPFCSIKFSSPGGLNLPIEKPSIPPNYAEPKSTNIETIHIDYEGDAEFSIPKTTA